MLLEFGLFTNQIIRYQTSWTGSGTGSVVNLTSKDEAEERAGAPSRYVPRRARGRLSTLPIHRSKRRQDQWFLHALSCIGGRLFACCVIQMALWLSFEAFQAPMRFGKLIASLSAPVPAVLRRVRKRGKAANLRADEPTK